MKRLSLAPSTSSTEYVCPDLTAYWQLGKRQGTDEYVLIAPEAGYQVCFSVIEGFALRYFVGRFSVAQVQDYCDHEFGAEIARDAVATLLQKLIILGILVAPEIDSPPTEGPRLKSSVQWLSHPDGYWILRNPEDLTFLQVDATTKPVIEQLGQTSLYGLMQQQQLEPAELQHLLKLLNATGMLEGSQVSPPPQSGFNPLKLLNFKLRLCNPDPWLTRHISTINWIWSRPGEIALIALFTTAIILALHQWAELWFIGTQLLQHLTPSIVISFLVLSACVVTLHELAHAFTLKHYGGSTPEVGVMFMLLMPIAYTNTTDQYSLQRRSQRALVVGAGVICQLVLAAIALIVWTLSASGSWLSTAAYLLMAASLFTVAINLNPLVKFDGYYLLVALSGINNLRQRSVQFYTNLLQLQPSPERQRDRCLLALYAPFSLLYSLVVFGYLLLWLGDWVFSHIPTTAVSAIAVWLLYRFSRN